MKLRLVVVPDVPFAEDALETAVAHRRTQHVVHRVSERRVSCGQRADVMPDRHRFRLDGEPGRRTATTFRQDIVEKDGIETPEQQIAVRMDVVVVRNRMNPMLALGAQQDFVRDGAAEGPDIPAPQVGQRPETRPIGVADAQHLAEFVIRNGHGQGGAPRRRVLDAAEAEVGVATLDRLVERCERDGDEPWDAVQSARQQGGDVDVEAHHLVGARRVRLNERRTAFRVARPAELPSRLGGGAAGRSHGDRRTQPDGSRTSPPRCCRP